jgi:hypothetical protein
LEARTGIREHGRPVEDDPVVVARARRKQFFEDAVPDGLEAVESAAEPDAHLGRERSPHSKLDRIVLHWMGAEALAPRLGLTVRHVPEP